MDTNNLENYDLQKSTKIFFDIFIIQICVFPSKIEIEILKLAELKSMYSCWKERLVRLMFEVTKLIQYLSALHKCNRSMILYSVRIKMEKEQKKLIKQSCIHYEKRKERKVCSYLRSWISYL